MTYYIRVRSEFVGYYTVKADNIVDAEHIAKQKCRDEMIGNGMDLHFDYDHIHEQKVINEMFDGDANCDLCNKLEFEKNLQEQKGSWLCPSCYNTYDDEELEEKLQ